MSFQEIAGTRGITTATAQLEALTWDVDSDGYQRLQVGDEPPLDALFKVLPRRGLDPTLVAPLFHMWPARPLERALIAYDFLDKTLLPTDDPQPASQLTNELAPLRSIATTDAAVPRDKLATLLAAVTPTDGAAARTDFATLPSLAGLTGCIELDDATIEAVYTHARTLARSHLPSLAIAFLQILVERLAPPRALELLVELALDADALAAIPAITGEDGATIRQQAYLLARVSAANFDVAGGEKILEAARQHPELAGGTDLNLLVVEAQLAVMQLRRLDEAGENAIDEIVSAAPGWRYGLAVQCAVRGARDHEAIVREVDNYILSFGDDPYVWAQAALYDDVHPALLVRLSQELRYGSFWPAAWRALSVITGETAIDDEVHARTSGQLQTALTAEETDQGFPRFDVPQPLADGRAWTARFQSFDLRTDTVYYRIRLFENGAIVDRIMCAFVSGERDTREVIQRSIASIAATGEANTDYAGYGDY